ncbi:MAG TPA: DUF2110 family protein [Candidatus Acidoferrum sp.]|nr:DUF2110 family protein [Candidatus Acidoferrum sp.]
MPTVTLLSKVYVDSQMKEVENNLKLILEGLDVETETLGTTSRGLLQISLSGEDETVALRYLAGEIGLCPTDLANVAKFSIVKGYLNRIDRNASELRVDIGVFQPAQVDAVIPLSTLQAQLADGRKLALPKLVELFDFHENLPLTIKIYDMNKENGTIEAALSEGQLALYRSWTKSLLDRLLILGASFNEVLVALKRAHYDREIAKIEPLGMFEHAVACKLGTDATGLIPKIGRNLRKAGFSVYNPRKIMNFFGADCGLLISS